MLSLLALASSACWGTSDFFAGLKSKSLPAAAVVAWSQGLGLLVVSLGVAVRHADLAFEGWPLWSVAAGLAGTTGLVCFYAALSSTGTTTPSEATGATTPIVPLLSAA